MKANRYTFWFLLASFFSGLAVALYWPAQNGAWVLDDLFNIAGNASLRDFSGTLGLLFQPRGLSFFSFALNIKLWGLDPTFFRWVNVAIHTMNSLLVVLLLRQLAGSAWRWAIVGGLVFLCHPVQTSAVSYIVQRMALLSAFFALAAILLVDRYFILVGEGRGGEARKFLFLSVFCGIFSVMSKENTVLLPLVIPLLAWFRGKGSLTEGWKPAFFLWLAISAVAIFFQYFSRESTVGGLTSVPLYKDTGLALYEKLADQDRAFLPIRYFLSQLEVFWVYLGLIIFPLHQALDYCWPIPDLRLSLLHLGTLTLILAGLWLVYKHRDRQPFLFFGLAWILIFVIVESSIIPLDPIFEHRLYLPLAGVIFIFGALDTLWLKKVAFPAALVVICLLAFMTWKRNRLWGDPVAFGQSNVRVVEKAPRPAVALAVALFAQKRFVEAAEEIKRVRSVLDIDDMMVGEALYFSGKTGEAMAAFHKAALDNDPGANGVELFNGYRAIQEGRYGEAVDWLDRADHLNADDVRSFYFRGLLAEAQNDPLGAVESYVEAMKDVEPHSFTFFRSYALWARERQAHLKDQLSDWYSRENAKVLSDPKDRQRRVEFANQLSRVGFYREAIEHYEAVMAMGESPWGLYYNLGIAYENLEKLADAEKNYKIAHDLTLNNPGVTFSYVKILWKLGKFSKAIDLLTPLVRQYPDDGRFLLLYGTLLKERGDINAARDVYMRASLIPEYKGVALQRLKRLNKEW